jgi:hypothetical protein
MRTTRSTAGLLLAAALARRPGGDARGDRPGARHPGGRAQQGRTAFLPYSGERGIRQWTRTFHRETYRRTAWREPGPAGRNAGKGSGGHRDVQSLERQQRRHPGHGQHRPRRHTLRHALPPQGMIACSGPRGLGAWRGARSGPVFRRAFCGISLVPGGFLCMIRAGLSAPKRVNGLAAWPLLSVPALRLNAALLAPHYRRRLLKAARWVEAVGSAPVVT